MNASFANVAKLERRVGPATVVLHPIDAAARGLREGDAAILDNETGSLALQVTLSDELLPGVALSPKGRWLRQEPERANVNVLNPGVKTDMGESTSVHGVEVRVSRAGHAAR
jgi:anaerobic selenocysteine-containing dehydrogenase